MAKRANRTAAPGTTDKAAAKAKVEKIRFTDSIEGLPEDWAGFKHDDERLAQHDNKTHLPLKADEFDGRWEHMRYRAAVMEERATKIREDADRMEKLGNIADVKKAKRLMQLQKQVADLTASLEADGQDVGDLLKALGLGGSEDAAD
jgi:hypothetical protein